VSRFKRQASNESPLPGCSRLETTRSLRRRRFLSFELGLLRFTHTKESARRICVPSAAANVSVDSWAGRFLFYNAFVDPLRELGRTLLLLGGLLAIVGAILYFGGKLPFRIGKLPGDIVYRGEHTTFYFPVVTCLLLSFSLSFILWLFSRFRR
jgi:hypothetical protein